MVATSTGNERVRAWVLFQADSARDVAERLYKVLGHESDDGYVVVRADVVARSDIVAGPSEFAYNIIVPVDAKSEEALREAVRRIKEILDEMNEVRVPVVVMAGPHFPNPPHNAHGYITTEEVEAGRERIEKPGRQGASPGHNAWG